jgi:endogenous inhibitor of DNA gyrase (YacG/DUF329 family)
MKPMAQTPTTNSRRVGKRCPICGKPAAEAARPFCSLRCKDTDLNRWLSGAYVIPAADDGDEDEAERPAGSEH